MIENTLIGFIGGGNMTEAILKGLLADGAIKADRILIAETLASRREFLASAYSVALKDNGRDIVSQTDVIILAIKPQMAGVVLTDLAQVLTSDKLIISIMAGVTTSFIESHLSRNHRVIRVMPNTAALIQEAATVICPGSSANETDMQTACEIFSNIGTVITTSEKMMDAVTGLSGSGPAYVFSFIEALSDAGVKNGLTRDISLKLSVQTVLGAARMISETGEHPAILKEKVASPGGTTIAGLHTLENGRFHGLIMDAVDSATIRSKELSEK